MIANISLERSKEIKKINVESINKSSEFLETKLLTKDDLYDLTHPKLE